MGDFTKRVNMFWSSGLLPRVTKQILGSCGCAGFDMRHASFNKPNSSFLWHAATRRFESISSTGTCTSPTLWEMLLYHIFFYGLIFSLLYVFAEAMMGGRQIALCYCFVKSSECYRLNYLHPQWGLLTWWFMVFNVILKTGGCNCVLMSSLITISTAYLKRSVKLGELKHE